MKAPKKPLTFQEVTFRAPKIKRFSLKSVLYFGKWNFLAPSVKKLKKPTLI